MIRARPAWEASLEIGIGEDPACRRESIHTNLAVAVNSGSSRRANGTVISITNPSEVVNSRIQFGGGGRIPCSPSKIYQSPPDDGVEN